MFGQGSPSTGNGRPATGRGPGTDRRGRGWLLAGWCCALAWAAPAGAEDLDLRLWIAWGGGPARQWQGEIRVEDAGQPGTAVGAITAVEPVGVQPDEPGSMQATLNAVRVSPRTPRSYDGVSLLVTAPREAVLVIQLGSADQPSAGAPIRVTLQHLIADAYNTALDERGNRLLVRRTAGDKLRVRFDHPALVFAPGERFECHVDPHLIEVEAGTSLTYGVQLHRARSGERLWEEQREAAVDPRGDAPAVGPFAIPLPNEEGAYDVLLTLAKRRLPTRLAPAKLLYQRTVQVLVVAPQPLAAPATAWQVLGEIAPHGDEVPSESPSAKGKFWEAIPKLPQWKWIPGSPGEQPQQKPLGNGRSRQSGAGDRPWLELAAGGWQAYPLPVSQLHRPHVVEVEFPTARRQTLGISILDPNAAGAITPPGLDSGVDVPADAALEPAGVERHRLVFWPRTTAALLLLANLRDDGPAVFGRIRVLAGPAVLPARTTPAAESGRLCGLYYDRPLFPENFLASDTLDVVTGRNLNDWVTFYEGGTRLVQYLKHGGYNGAMLSVLYEGSALYPSRLLESVPKYDNGLFFATGQDPLRKDVLELLLRLFDREGLKLVPALHFAAPLPELEALLRREVPLGRSPASAAESPENASVTGIELVGADGRSWRERLGSERSTGPRYNPLDPRVQAAIRHVVAELTARYGRHPSLAGVAIQLGPQTYAQLPDADWGYDEATLARFAEEEKLTVPGLTSGDRAQPAAYLSGDGQERWLRWRARKLAEFYASLQADLAAQVRGARLYLTGADLFAGPELQRQLQPRLPERCEPERLLLQVGLDPQQFPPDGGVLLLRPHRLAPLTSLEAQAANLTLNRAAEVDLAFGVAGPLRSDAAPASTAPTTPAWRSTTGSLFYHEPQSLPLPAFDKVSPFGTDKTQTWLFSVCSPAGSANRRRFVHSLATLDSQALFDGSWMAPLGQQETLLDLLEVYRRLPDKHFVTVAPKNATSEPPPVVIRALREGNRTYVYAVNDSPWPVAVALDFTAAQPVTVQSLSSRKLPPPVQRGNQATWEVSLAPYDLVGATLDVPEAAVADWRATVSRDVFVELRKGLDDLRRRANLLREPQPMAVLANPGFEQAASGDLLPGWDYARQDSTSVRLDRQQSHAGTQSLHVRSGGPVVWVRSHPFPVPKTGRLSVWVWLKIDQPDEQPPLRLAIEGRLNGQTYYRPAEVGAGSGAGGPPPLTGTWAPYLLRIDNLPTSGLTDLRVAFDLMGRGEVWIDDVQVFDLWFDKTERNELLKQIALANFHLGKGDAAQCARILEGYWPEFLRRHVLVDATQLADAPRDDSPTPTAAPGPVTESGEEPKASTSWLQRLMPKPPKMPNFFR